jgi:hypothetical protein
MNVAFSFGFSSPNLEEREGGLNSSQDAKSKVRVKKLASPVSAQLRAREA